MRIELCQRLHIYIETLAAEIVASAGGNDEYVVANLLARQCFGGTDDQAAGSLALAGEGGTLGHELGFKTVGQHHIGGLVKELGAFAVGEFAHGREAIGLVCALLFDAVLGLHAEFGSHLVAIVSLEIFVEEFVVASNRAAYAGGVGRKDSGHLRTIMSEEEHTQARHPFVCLIHHLVRSLEAVLHHGLREASSRITEHRSLVVIAVGTHRIYVEEFPGLGVNLVFLFKIGLEIHEHRNGLPGHVPTADAYAEVFLFCRLFPFGQQEYILHKHVIPLSQLRADEGESGSGKLLQKCVGARREDGIDAAHLIAHLPTGFKEKVGGTIFCFRHD